MAFGFWMGDGDGVLGLERVGRLNVDLGQWSFHYVLRLNSGLVLYVKGLDRLAIIKGGQTPAFKPPPHSSPSSSPSAPAPSLSRTSPRSQHYSGRS